MRPQSPFLGRLRTAHSTRAFELGAALLEMIERLLGPAPIALMQLFELVFREILRGRQAVLGILPRP